ncbi:probable ATP-dependent RNA helicase DDX46 [Otolemur garnettii]|uniref:probable ATP-dependent RNA helicase DDX46 n=1 Tax=Otolemur garnettii TaxID=30611 RepID=UPI000C7EB012|nr:probable ATP-dependent RNA helicase DDX46 [Otolemur garnettii]
MGRESRHYRKRSASRGRSGSRSRSRSPSDKRSKRGDDRRSRSRDRDRRRERSRSRDKRRSRSRDRKRLRRSRSRERDRSRERRRSRSRDRRRSRSRSRGRRSRSSSPGNRSKKAENRSRSKEKTDGGESSKEKKKDKDDKEDEKEKDAGNFDQNKLEEEMRKRKERVEKWREEQRKKAMENIGELKKEIEEMKQGKKWSLEDDDDDEDDPAEAEKEGSEMEGEELDPLDAYMEEVKEEVKKFNMRSVKGGGGNEKYSSEEEEVDLQTALTGYQTKQRKLLEPVDHGKIEYEPFRKNFYVEVPELAKMSQEEVNVFRLEMEGITVKGKGCPKPIKSWVQCGISMKILNSLKKHGYEKPTPIQTQAIPAIMSGRDLIGIAKTGSGKTIAFLLPMFRHIMDQRSLEEGEGPIAVIMTPTRELALQITKECKKFSKTLGLRVVCVYGGTGISEQIAELKRGAEIIVCTPGRMIDMLAANSGRVTNLRRVTYVVLDEADRMFDMGFEPQGYAYTFITEDQARYAGDIIKALEFGFSGKGFKFDETEQALANERKKLQKAALGLQDSDDEDAAVDIDEQIESMFNSKKRVKDMAAPGTSSVPAPTAGNAEKLEIAKRLALRINAQKNLGIESQVDVMQQATNAILRGGTILAPTVSAKTIAEQLAEKINAKLNYVPLEKQEEERQDGGQNESFKRYEEELEINDFPQTARWKVTSKEALQRISEYSEAAITIRGTYFPPGKEPKEGERKIYLAIESANELAVQKAKAEITRLIKEELIRLQNSYQPTNKGRYKVL